MTNRSSTRTRTGRRLLALLAALAMVAVACGNDDDGGVVADDDTGTGTEVEDGDGAEVSSALFTDAQENGIRLGIADEAPYAFEDPATGEASGYSPTVAKEVLGRLGITEVDATVVDFGGLIDGLNADRYDIVTAGMFVTEERASQALFTDPDICVNQGFAVPEGNPQGLEDFESVAADPDVTLGVLRGAVEAGFATDAGVARDQLSEFDTTADMQDALTSGRIDAYALTAISVVDFANDTGGVEAVTFPIEGTLNCGAYVFRFENIDARDEFNEVLVEMRENGEIASVASEFPIFDESGSFDAAKGVSVEDIIGMPYDFAV